MDENVYLFFKTTVLAHKAVLLAAEPKRGVHCECSIYMQDCPAQAHEQMSPLCQELSETRHQLADALRVIATLQNITFQPAQELQTAQQELSSLHQEHSHVRPFCLVIADLCCLQTTACCYNQLL